MRITIGGFRGLAISTDLLLSVIFAGLGILYLASKIISNHVDDGLDFRVIWLAGDLWASGQDPYGPSFLRRYNEVFGTGPDALWLYPPCWYPIAVPLSFLPFPVANLVWKAVNFLLLMASSHFIACALADGARQRYLPIFLGSMGFACLMQATAVTIYNGQTSILIHFGFSAMLFGILKKRPLLLIFALIFLALKPQIGIVAFAAVASLRRYRWTIIPAGAICLLATIPIAFTGSYRASIEGFLLNLTQHSGLTVNSVPDMIGMIHILDYAFSISRPSVASSLLILITITIAIVTFYTSSINGAADARNAQNEIACFALLIASVFFFVPLHSYDLVSLSALLMMIPRFPVASRWIIAFALLICMRPGNISEALGIANPASRGFPESLLVSGACCLLVFVFTWAVLVSPSQDEKEK